MILWIRALRESRRWPIRTDGKPPFRSVRESGVGVAGPEYKPGVETGALERAAPLLRAPKAVEEQSKAAQQAPPQSLTQWSDGEREFRLSIAAGMAPSRPEMHARLALGAQQDQRREEQARNAQQAPSLRDMTPERWQSITKRERYSAWAQWHMSAARYTPIPQSQGIAVWHGPRGAMCVEHGMNMGEHDCKEST